MKKRSFWERITGGIRMENDEETRSAEHKKKNNGTLQERESLLDEGDDEGQLTVDVYQTPTEIVVQTMVAGVRPEDLQINITRDMITVKGKREESRIVSDDNYFVRELYWGSFSRTILLPQEVEPEEAEAVEKHGMLIIKIPKVDKNRQTNLRVKSL